ncbi:hypothetical protein M9H77_07292 [Catharanthus roseus]|uniref:Uncharacterized protein n=1 Tax=Catharanthus roseus TaxID=4058 RepID=A0ACC0BUH7_CATRO|nr:hypothetical protein M9H77_07292 [Catharanthus roseus]
MSYGCGYTQTLPWILEGRVWSGSRNFIPGGYGFRRLKTNTRESFPFDPKRLKIEIRLLAFASLFDLSFKALGSNPSLVHVVGSLSKSFEEVLGILTVLLPSILASSMGRTNLFKEVPKAFTGSTLVKGIVRFCCFARSSRGNFSSWLVDSTTNFFLLEGFFKESSSQYLKLWRSSDSFFGSSSLGTN